MFQSGPLESLQYTITFSLAGCLSMKIKQICIWSRFCKHGSILLKFGMQATKGSDITGNGNMIKINKIKWVILGDWGIQ
jgi:hypothetical protein